VVQCAASELVPAAGGPPVEDPALVQGGFPRKPCKAVKNAGPAEA